MRLELNSYYNMDCMEGMKLIPDKYFDLAIVDPPYFTGPEKRNYYGRRVSPIGVQRKYKPSKEWNLPDDSYFKELVRISNNQIVWGINYFPTTVLNGSGRIVWDKVNGSSSFSDCEIAYCSYHDSVRIFRYMWNGMMQGKSISEGSVQQGDKGKNEVRIHPTQKPIKLYKWLLYNYAKTGDKILDTHVGSASSLIACHEMGFEFMGFEKDEVYYKTSLDRLNKVRRQISMFDLEAL